MKKLKLCLLSIFTLISFNSCVKDAKESVQEGNFKVEFLFEHDGCKVYRFEDGGRYIYWSNCSGKMQSDFQERTGKSTRRVVRKESFTTNH